jgi:hypothetical protein
MVPLRKPYPSLADYARHMVQEALMAEDRAVLGGRAAPKADEDGEAARAEAMRSTCRKIRVGFGASGRCLPAKPSTHTATTPTRSP